MTPDQVLLAAASGLVALGLVVLMCTAPGSGPVAYAASLDWLTRHGRAALAWRMRRANARRYHRHGSPGVRHHIRPTVIGRTRTLARRVPSGTPAIPAPVRTHPDTVPWDVAAARLEATQPIQPIRQFARTS